MSDNNRVSAVWGQRWLEALEQDPTYGTSAVAVGERVARAHAEPDVHIRPGEAQVTVTAGPRRRYHTTLLTPVFDDAAWDTIFDQIASSPARAAAVASGTLDASFDDDLRLLKLDLLPAPGELTTNCDCAGWSTPCKHVAAAIVAVADIIDDDPMLLLALRGRHRPEVLAALEARRPSSSGSEGLDELATEAWLRPTRPLPVIEIDPALTPGPTPTWGAPPSTAPFNAAGLEVIGTDLIRRAAGLLSGEATTALELDPLSDLARIAHSFSLPKERKRLAEHSGVSARELGVRATAWSIAGSAGVRAHVSPAQTHRVSVTAQVRRVEHDGASLWFRFEKRSGRWGLAAGPVGDPEDLLSNDAIDQ